MSTRVSRRRLNETTKPEACKIKIVEDPVKGWTLIVGKLSPVCQETFVQITRNLGPHAKKYLASRIKTDNPEVKDTLKKMGLSTSKDT